MLPTVGRVSTPSDAGGELRDIRYLRHAVKSRIQVVVRVVIGTIWTGIPQDWL